MRIIWALCAIVALFVPASAPLVAGAPDDPLAGDKPFKNVGVYWAGPESYGKLKTLGANLITSNFANDTQVRLYWAQKQGVQLILFNSAWIDDSVAGGRVNTALVCQNVNAVKNHPALWGYYVIDEPSRHVYPSGAANPTSLATMQALYKTVKGCHPAARTLATFLPGGGFGTAANNFGANVADYVLFDTYYKAPDGLHPEWITDAPLPAAIRLAKSRDPDIKVWAAIQSFAVNSSSSRIAMTTRAEVQRHIDLLVQTHDKLKIPLDGVLFFLWDKFFDSKDTELTDDLRSHRDYWNLIAYAAGKLPAVAGAAPPAAGAPAPLPSFDEYVRREQRPADGIVTQRCDDPGTTGVIEGTITRVNAAGVAFIGADSFFVDDTSNILQFTTAGTPLGTDYIQPGAYVKVFPRKQRTLGSVACKVLVKPIFNLKFTVLKVVRRKDLPYEGAILTVREGHVEVNTGAGPLPFATIEVDGDLATKLEFTNPPDTPEMPVTVENIWKGSLLQVKAGFIGGSPSNLRAVDLVVLPNNTGLMEVTGPAANGRFPVESLSTPKRKITNVRLNSEVDLYFSGKNGAGTNVQIKLARSSIQPQGNYTFIGGYYDASTAFTATVGYQVPVTFTAIVTDVLASGANLKVMGPDFIDGATSVITALLGNAGVFEQLEDGRQAPLALGKISDYSTVNLTGYWTALRTFTITKAVFYYVAPPAP